MKTRLLIVFFLLSLGIAKAQNSSLLRDSSFTSSDGGKTLQFNSAKTYTYSSFLCRTSDIKTTYADTANHLPYSTNYQYYYYSDTNSYYTIYQVQQTANDTFVNNLRTSYTFTPAKQNTSTLIETWSGSGWTPSSFDTSVYNASGQLTLTLNMNWDANQQAFVNSTQTIEIYDAGGKMVDLVSQQWNLSAGIWVTNHEETFIYDANEYLISKKETFINQSQTIRIYDAGGKNINYLSQVWDTTSNTWVNEYEQIYVYDANEYLVSDSVKSKSLIDNTFGLSNYGTFYNDNKGLVDSDYLVETTFEDSIRTYFIYYANTTVRQQITAYDYLGFDNQVPFSGSRDIYLYDSSNNVYTDSSILQIALAPNFVFTNQLINITQTTYNTDKQQTQQISQYQTFGIGNTTTSYYQTNYIYGPCSYLLPVHFLSFTALQKNADALLQWQTGTETNTASFTIERSVDGIHFFSVGQVMAAANAATGKSYTFTDANIVLLSSSTIYYRLTEKDKDGRSTYSNVAKLTLTDNKLTVSVSPNPVGNTIVIHSPVNISNALITVSNISGVRLYNAKQQIAAGGKVLINASAFAKGVYIVSVEWAGNKKVFKIVK